jgi:acyl dehydratase
MADSDWITETTRRVAADTGLDPATLLVDATAAERLLDLAGFAAHDSGERTNAPLLCFVLGRAVALGVSLDALDQSVRAQAGP